MSSRITPCRSKVLRGERRSTWLRLALCLLHPQKEYLLSDAKILLREAKTTIAVLIETTHGMVGRVGCEQSLAALPVLRGAARRGKRRPSS
jgi:hypothetical protein